MFIFTSVEVRRKTSYSDIVAPNYVFFLSYAKTEWIDLNQFAFGRHNIILICPFNVDIPLLYMKLGFYRGIHSFLFFGSNVYTQSMV